MFWPLTLAIVAYSCAVVYVWDDYPKFHFNEIKDALSLTTMAIGLIFAFRTNNAYDKWWEARRLWGQLVNDLRNLGIKLNLYCELSASERERFGKLLAAFPVSLKQHLRNSRFEVGSMGLSDVSLSEGHVPLYLSSEIQKEVLNCNRKNDGQGLQLLMLDAHSRALMDICGACERIKNTPLPPWFTVGIWIWLSAYLIVLPWLLAPHLDFWTVAIVMFVAYFGLSLEMLAEQMQEPFGCEVNDLALDQICLTIRKSLEQIFGTSIGDLEAPKG